MTTKQSNKKFLKGIAVAFLLPLSFYIIISILSKDKLHLPRYYVADSVVTVMEDGKAVQDTIFHRVADISLTNQFGKTVSLNNDLKGKILVVDFIYTSCATTCPLLSDNMEMLQKAFKKDFKKENSLDTAVHFISITVDPEHDSFQVLRHYADKYTANPDHWWFLTGSRADIYNFARKQLFVNMEEGSGGLDDFIHTDKMVLIDTARYIRGYYNGTDTADVIRCADDIVILTKQKIRKKK